VAAFEKFEPLGSIPGKTWIFLLLSGLATGASWLAYFRALKLGQASHVAPVDKLSVVLVAIFGVLFLGETLKPMGWVGVALVGSGAVVMVLAS
jgi:bacterial/archaeal transporter family protein